MPRKRRTPAELRVRLPRGGDPQAFLDAAYLWLPRASVRIEGATRSATAVFSPKGARLPSAEDFLADYEAARARRLAARRSRPLDAALLGRALEMARRVDARRAAPEEALPPERLAEIARLLAEAQAAGPETEGYSTPWRGGSGA